MTLEKSVVMTYEKHPFFTPEEAKLNKIVKVIEVPKMVTLKKNNKEKLFVTIQIGKKPEYDDEDSEDRIASDIRVWSMGVLNRNRAIDLLGNDETKWVNKTLPVEILRQVVENKRRNVVYVEGAVKEEDD